MFNKISTDFFVDKYLDVDNSIVTSEEVEACSVERPGKMRQQSFGEMTKSKEMRSDFNLDREDICNESGLPDATVI